MLPEDRRNRYPRPTPPDEPSGPDGPNRPRIGRQMLIWVIAIGVALVGLLLYQRLSRPAAQEISLGQLQVLLNDREVARLEIEGVKVHGLCKSPPEAPMAFRVVLSQGFIDDHMDEWTEALPQDGLKVKEPAFMPMLLLQLTPVALLFLLMIFLFNRQMRAANPRDGFMPFVGNSTRTKRSRT